MTLPETGAAPDAPAATATRPAAPEARGGFTTTDALLTLMTLIWGINVIVVKAALTVFPPLAFNAFYQEGEMADEGARVCIDAGDLDTAERAYRRGYDLGTKEPEPRTHRRSLWDFRLAHALARIAARRGDAQEAGRQVAAARQALDGDTAMARQQERFFPYLVGYVALYTNDLATAERELTRAVALRGNERDPFLRCLLAMVYERQSRQDDARAAYRQADELATAHNPPAAFAKPFARQKLGPARP
jgi:tetratricopeptide (TPR) repeat protein